MSGDESEVPGDPEEDPSLMLDSDMYITDEDDSIERIKRWVVGTWIDLKLWAKLRYLNTRIWIGERRQLRSKSNEISVQETPVETKAMDGIEIPPVPTFGVPEKIEDEVHTVPIPDSGYVIRDRHSAAENDRDEIYTFSPAGSNFQSKFVVMRLVRSLDLLYGFIILAVSMAIFDRIYDLSIYPEWSDVTRVTDRFLQPYEGTILPEFFRGAIVFIFLILSGANILMGGRAKKGIFFLFMATILSIVLRIYPVWFEGWEKADFLPLILDLLMGSLFLVSATIPGLARGLFEQPTYVLESVHVESQGGAEATPQSPEELPDTPDLGYTGDTVPSFDVARPIPPKRRQPGSYSLYEMLFLLLAMTLWPVAITVHTILALEIPTRMGTWTMEEFGVKALSPLYLLAFICSYLVLGMDRDARSGEVYAKEKAAYHADMDQYLSLKETYYEFKAAELSISDKSEE